MLLVAEIFPLLSYYQKISSALCGLFSMVKCLKNIFESRFQTKNNEQIHITYPYIYKYIIIILHVFLIYFHQFKEHILIKHHQIQ